MENKEKDNCHSGNYESHDENYNWVALYPPAGRTWYSMATLSQKLLVIEPTVIMQLQRAEREGS